ncbi:MAG: hypothetical protein HZA59_04925 [Hydrogenophilales bacterium]|nr:hypothetical protein [Hydrogenophilales bacterium]
MKAQTRFSTVTMALAITAIAPAFAEVTTQPTTTQASTTTTASVTTGTGAGTPTTPPTTTMNKGQTDIATSLAKAQLTQYGITQPTPEQLNAALNGGTISTGTGAGAGAKTVQLQGVLTQRASGQGWGQIANGMGVKLGTVVSGAKSQHHDAHEVEGREHGKHITTADGGEHHKHKESKHITHAGEKTEHHAKHSSKHITTAAGASGGVYSREQGKHHSAAVTTAGGKAESGHHEHGKRYGAGIVTAAGGSYVPAKYSQHHQEHGAGIVTASSAGSSGAGQGHSDEGSKHGKSGK